METKTQRQIASAGVRFKKKKKCEKRKQEQKNSQRLARDSGLSEYLQANFAQPVL